MYAKAYFIAGSSVKSRFQHCNKPTLKYTKKKYNANIYN